MYLPEDGGGGEADWRNLFQVQVKAQLGFTRRVRQLRGSWGKPDCLGDQSQVWAWAWDQRGVIRFEPGKPAPASERGLFLCSPLWGFTAGGQLRMVAEFRQEGNPGKEEVPS